MIPRAFRSCGFSSRTSCSCRRCPRLALEPNALPPGARPCLSDLSPPGFGRFRLNSEQFVQYPGVDPFPGFSTVLSGYLEFTSPAAYTASNVLVLAPGGYRTLLLPRNDGRSRPRTVMAPRTLP